MARISFSFTSIENRHWHAPHRQSTLHREVLYSVEICSFEFFVYEKKKIEFQFSWISWQAGVRIWLLEVLFFFYSYFAFVNFISYYIYLYLIVTIESGINIAPWINVAPGTFGRNNKHSPLKKHIPLHQMIDFRTFLWITLFNKDVAPGKNSKN